jgi:hypothetical protein
MATYSNLGIKLITTGDESGTWGTSTNTNFSDVIDEAIAGVVTYNIGSDANFTLTVSDATSSDARHAVIKFTSTTLTATRTCTLAPDDLQKVWVVVNATTGGQSLTFKQGSSGATVTVPNGESAIIYSDGAGASAGAITRVLDSFTNTAISTSTLTASSAVVTGASGILTRAAATQDAVEVIGRAGGTSSYKVTLTPTTLSASRTLTLPDVSGTAAVLGSAQTFTAAQTFRAASAVRSEAAATQDAVVLAGRAGGTSSYAVTLTPTTLSANRTVTIPDETFTVGYRNIPAVGTKTGSYTLATGDVGKYVQVGSGGSITIPDATFAEGDVVSIFNNTTGAITITCTITTAYIAGTDSDKATVSLATRGVATILFISGTVCVISGNVS